MKKALLTGIKWIGILAGLAFLTILTQLGALVILLWLPLKGFLKRKVPIFEQRRWVGGLSFFAFWCLFSLLIIPQIAKPFGREALPVFGEKHLKPFHIGYCLLNRHYVRPRLKQATIEVAAQMQEKYPGTVLAYLDGGFPFGYKDKLPLLPHLSHYDGKKLDLAFFFVDEETEDYLPRKALTSIAYGGSVVPRKGEYDKAAECEAAGYWQYSFMHKYFPKKSGRVLDEKRTQHMLRLFAKHKQIGKLLLEPHIKTRLRLNYNKVRFHGCRAVRHDDHVHVQL